MTMEGLALPSLSPHVHFIHLEGIVPTGQNRHKHQPCNDLRRRRREALQPDLHPRPLFRRGERHGGRRPGRVRAAERAEQIASRAGEVHMLMDLLAGHPDHARPKEG